jgi:hypothetical protein
MARGLHDGPVGSAEACCGPHFSHSTRSSSSRPTRSPKVVAPSRDMASSVQRREIRYRRPSKNRGQRRRIADPDDSPAYFDPRAGSLSASSALLGVIRWQRRPANLPPQRTTTAWGSGPPENRQPASEPDRVTTRWRGVGVRVLQLPSVPLSADRPRLSCPRAGSLLFRAPAPHSSFEDARRRRRVRVLDLDPVRTPPRTVGRVAPL